MLKEKDETVQPSFEVKFELMDDSEDATQMSPSLLETPNMNTYSSGENSDCEITVSSNPLNPWGYLL